MRRRLHSLFKGTRSASRLTGNFHFHGKHILTSVLQDLVANFGIDRAGEMVLVGSGAGARGVGHSCDYVAEAMRAVNPQLEMRCVLDSPDLVPWWVKTDTCNGEDLNQMELQHLIWGRQLDQSCLDANTKLNTTELYHKCGVFSRYWEYIETPFFLISSQYDPQYFDNSPCVPSSTQPEYPGFQLSWRRGTIALMESMVAKRSSVGVFSANCDSHTVLDGVLARPYWSSLSVPLLNTETQSQTDLSSLLASWREAGSGQAIDSLMRNNSQCVSAAPHTACSGRLVTCSQTRLLPSLARGWATSRSVVRRLSPPSYLWPSSYDLSRRCGLDPYYSSCGGCSRGCQGTFLSASGDRVVPESAIPASGRKGRLWRRFYYLQYIKLLYTKLKAEYAREYYRAKQLSPHEKLFPLSGIQGHSAIDYDYDYYDDYFDDYTTSHTGGLFARIVKAVRKNKGKNKNNRISDPSTILLDSVKEDFEFPQELLDSLPDLEDIEYEDFEILNESLDKFSRRQKSET